MKPMLTASTLEPHRSRHPDVAEISHLTSGTRIKLIRTMKVGHAIKRTYAAPLQLALAFLFLAFTSVQPGLFSMASAERLTAKPAEISQGHAPHAVADHAHEGGHDADADAGHAQSKAQHHETGKFADGGCVVHCAPVTAVPVDCPFLQWPAGSGHGVTHIVALVDSDTSVLARPPRS
ncbi:MAG: hypothetical protein ABJC48_12535 [Sulfitobacter pontiacus]|uniref:hypothetical protein n=1 Tax=Sulfitobacter pontiacus TaxID=60137 RepID=UPI00326510DD